MARMIPPHFVAATPAGEALVFERLRDDPGTKGWVVFHSLGIQRHVTKLQGEIDMVVLVPGVGVLCLEIKGCDVRREAGKWIYPYETSIEGPFKQASAGMHSLRRYVTERAPTLSRILFLSGVIFTLVEFQEESPEWHPWQFVNRSRLMRQEISKTLRDMLECFHAYIRGLSKASWYDPAASRPTEVQIGRLAAVIRPEFEYLVSARSRAEDIERAIRRFTEEQFEALDQLEDNERVVFRGPAGTGKTVLALETARRALASNRRVLLVCFNTMLGEWLKSETAGLPKEQHERLFCGTLHSLLRRIVGDRNSGGQGEEFWRHTLPVAAADVLLGGEPSIPGYDLLVIDEAQDLLFSEPYLDVLDLLLRGGLAGGRWAVFGDYERQAIYLSAGREVPGSDLLDPLRRRAPHHSVYSLRTNCRNSQSIAEAVTLTAGLVPGYRRVLHDMHGSEVQPEFYESSEAQSAILVRAIASLRKTYRPDEIAVLSMKGDELSCAAQAMTAQPGMRLSPRRAGLENGTIGYCTIHAFKGLESPAVILTDIERLNDNASRALLYVGMSRARIHLTLLMSEGCRAAYGDLLNSGLMKTAGR